MLTILILVLALLTAAVIAVGALLKRSGRENSHLLGSFHVNVKLSDLYRWDGTVDRAAYLFIGVIGFALKHNLDRLVATLVFHRRWGIFNYWIPPATAVRITTLPREDADFLACMLAMALPFIWVGVALTLRRLRAVRLPLWLIVFFFVPVINLAFFAVLSVLPSREKEDSASGSPVRGQHSLLAKVIPDHPLGSAAMAILLTFPVGVAATGLAVLAFGGYGWGLFVALPFCLGLSSALLYGYRQPRSLSGCMLVSALTIVLLGGGLVALAVEGVLCVTMAAPIAILLALLGGSIGYVIQTRPLHQGEVPTMMLVLTLTPPGLMAAESLTPRDPQHFEVRTAIEIEARPEEVWRQLISFPPLPEPEEWLFRLGIAYPIQSSIQGRGAGALRQCRFSTGTFTERIEVWDEPHELRFSVTSQPSPMQELTPYAEIRPRHLGGYFHPEGAQFQLVEVRDGRTCLQGTSWYRHDIWPTAYWRLWSDLILHQIHWRVFRHIKRLAEQDWAARTPRNIDRSGLRPRPKTPLNVEARLVLWLPPSALIPQAGEELPCLASSLFRNDGDGVHLQQ